MSRVVLATWAARHRVETEASVRFGALGTGLAAAGAPEALVALATRASTDEQRHAGHCARAVVRWGGDAPVTPARLVTYAPAALGPLQRLLYEVVAQCCVAETESTATLVALLDGVEDAALRPVLHELARDEVGHARLGWGTLAWARQRTDLSFLGPLLPAMVEGSAGPDVFSAGAPEEDDAELLAYGVLPHGLRREVYRETLDTVIVPGFAEHGIDVGPLGAWLATRARGSGEQRPH